ncbi:DUF2953 domain-containing protein [Methanoculleus sp. 10]|jgi:hypothetical protein|uniref:DUF2953 domain-containing protein n=1 Tax=Methanoculleus sp. 10 TaxID=430615 RepID=UPI001B71AC54|nr:DUF2953 domain-containing protein [Methanoculleus sp. 10]MBP7410566.1 DUF2953 domain-containing protein [Methanoculleus sp.]
MAATLLFSLLLAIVVILLAILLALYLVPVTVSTVADCRRESLRGTATVAWGIVGARVRADEEVQAFEILLAGRPVMTRDLREMARAPPEEEKAEARRPALPVTEYIGAARDLWPHVRRILAAFFRSLYLETLRGEVTLGLESPADTGVIYGYCTAVRYALWPAEAIEFVMTPVFDREVFEGTFTLRAQIRRPLLIAIPVVRALLQKRVRQRLRQVSGRGAWGA